MLNNIRKLESRILKEESVKYKRNLLKQIDFTIPIIGIIGHRGIGKSTLLIQYTNLLKEIYEPYKSLYFSYDYLDNIDIDFFDLAKELHKVGVEYLVIDKLDKFSNFEEELIRIHKVLPYIKIIFSATSFLKKQTNIFKAYYLKGLSYREFLEIKLNMELPIFTLEEILNDSTYIVNKLESKFKPLEYFNEYLLCGYYPFYFNHQNNYIKELNTVINQAIDVDLLSQGLVRVNFLNKIKKLLILIAKSNSTSLNITEIASKLEVSRNSVYTYLKHLEKVGLINSILNSKKSESKLSKPEKIYLNNTNLSYCLANDEKMEIVRETFFVSQLKRDFFIAINSEEYFLINNENILEIGIRNRDIKQIDTHKKRYLVVDTDKTENKFKIPLWLFGFLY